MYISVESPFRISASGLRPRQVLLVWTALVFLASLYFFFFFLGCLFVCCYSGCLCGSVLGLGNLGYTCKVLFVLFPIGSSCRCWLLYLLIAGCCSLLTVGAIWATWQWDIGNTARTMAMSSFGLFCFCLNFKVSLEFMNFSVSFVLGLLGFHQSLMFSNCLLVYCPFGFVLKIIISIWYSIE